MTKRLQTLLSALTPCRKLADVGCDHGYLSKAALDSGLAEAVVVSDISSPSLEKAKAL
ncbi:MAG: tRNA (adenine(22)-N(1))-methyltransferase TrmK, partial [Clostridia bacterium]|nr:tRNA (adenine(22)-N(1))-methyltransferase TrmK [Clostridia bacterium]